MKKRSLLSSIVAILLCLCMIAGSTFALFTSESKVNIAVTSGKVELLAEIADMTLYSMGVEQPADQFENGGTATVADNRLTLDRMTPGDKVALTLRLQNNSNVAIRYRSEIAAVKDTGLLSGLSVSFGGAPFASGSLRSDWAYLDAGEQPEPGTVSLTIELPEAAGNVYQDKAVTLAITVHAVQANADVSEPEDLPDADITADAELPIITEDDTLTEAASYAAGDLSILVPAGTRVESGRNSLSIRVTRKPLSDSNLTAEQNERLSAFDVHIEGLAPENTVPALITLRGVLPKNLNSSAIRLGHVEGGTTVLMQYIPGDEPLDTHNQFHYDPATGDLTLALASFSEIAMLVDPDNPWGGDVDTTWYNDTDTQLTIRNAEQLAGLAQLVTNGDSFAGKTVSLAADVSLTSSSIFYPIGAWSVQDGAAFGPEYEGMGAFMGCFDGTGHKISGLRQEGWEMKGSYTDQGYYRSGFGLFGILEGATVKNLTLDDFNCIMELAPMGCLAAYANGSCRFENIAVTNADMSTYQSGTAAIVGWASGGDMTFKNISVDDSNAFRALWGVYDTAAGGLMGYWDGEGEVSFENCHVACELDVYNDACANYQYFWYRYSGMYIGTVDKMATDESSRQMPDLSGIRATNCTVHIGDWSHYYYCEQESAGVPSYAVAGQYKFRRCTEDELVRDASGQVTGCTHNHTEAEDNRAVHLPFSQLFNGYGWGVDAVDIDEWNAGHDNQIEIKSIASMEKFSVKFENTADYLYRVGNGNAIALGSLFAALEGKSINQSGVYVSMTKLDINTDVAMTFTPNTTDWAKGTIQFTGTGPVRLTIQDYNACKPTELLLEVVDGVNATKATSATSSNVVLLNDVSGSFSVSNGYTFYGNGFEVTLPTTYVSTGFTGYVTLSNGHLDNVSIIGPVYPEAYIWRSQAESGTEGQYNYLYGSVMAAAGDCTITNSYISGSRTPIYVKDLDSLLIENSTVEGGSFANMEIGGAGDIILKNVTTVQTETPDSYGQNKSVIGFGVVVSNNMVNLYIEDEFEQYNWINQEQWSALLGSYENYFPKFFTDSTYSQYQFDRNGTKYVNMGIIYNCEWDSTKLHDNHSNTDIPYASTGITISGMGQTANGSVHSIVGGGTLTDDLFVAPAYAPTTQGPIAPTYSFDFTSKNYIPYDQSSNDYCYEETGVVKLSFDDGETFNWDTSILDIQKNGNNLPYQVTMNGIDYTGKSIPFTSTGDYQVIYSYTDSANYTLANGQVVTYTVTYNKTVHISAVAVKAAAKHAEFTFGTSNNTSTTVTIGNSIYVMPANGGDGSVTIDGTTVYYTNAEMTASDGKTEHSGTDKWHARFPVFYGVVSITDYADAGLGDAVTYDASTQTMPEGLTAVASSTNGSSWTVQDASKIFLYSMNATNYPAPLEPSYEGGYLYHTSYKNGLTSNTREESYLYVRYEYKENAGATYFYVVRYHCPEMTEASCITPETLITLADGTQKEVQYLLPGDELLVWNMYTGQFDTAPAMFINTHDSVEKDYEVTHLTFSDGTVVKIIGEHAFWNSTLNQYVYLNASNAKDYIGHAFNQQYVDANGEFAYRNVELVQAETTVELTVAYQPVTYEYLCCYVNGMLSMPGDITGMFNYFDVDPETMKYDEEAMQADIETYGILTYEEFAEYLYPSEFMYNAIGAKYVKVTIGKGLVTMEELQVLAARYAKFFES